MEFHEKLQELRKNNGLTQEELAEALYVSRTAISKWESGRGYPNIDSLKEISRYFSVSIDDLLSSEKLLSIAEKENKTNIQNICHLLFGIVDLFSFVLIFLPLYPNMVNGFIYSVNLLSYTQTTPFNRGIYWTMFVSLILMGVLRIVFMRIKTEKNYKIITDLSIVLHILIILFLSLAREPYAVTVAFSILIAPHISSVCLLKLLWLIDSNLAPLIAAQQLENGGSHK